MDSDPYDRVNMDSPDLFPSSNAVRCNLESQFNEARDSNKSSTMEVFARIRPMLPHEKANGFQECIFVDDNILRAVVPTTSAKYKSSRKTDEIIEEYTFTAAFPPETGQFVFFQETMLNSMQNFIEGSNSLVFSYGITGSGKTYTLQGDSENPGIIPLSLKLYFGSIERKLLPDLIVKPQHHSDIAVLTEKEARQEYLNKKQILSMYDSDCESAPGSYKSFSTKSFAMSLCEFFYDGFECEERTTTLAPDDMAAVQAASLLKEVCRKSVDQQLGFCSVWVYFIEIYNENVYDLLQPPPVSSSERKSLRLGEDKNGNVYLKGVTEINVSNCDEALKLLNIGRKNLSIASTKMNYQSSRSHCIYSIRVVRIPDPRQPSSGNVSQLSFCDLAGSERAFKTQTSGTRLKEAGSINTSLLYLGRCLEQLRAKQMGKDVQMIPFRNSKLTRMFSTFFMGQGKAMMIANASPCDYTFDETLHVLKFSALARKLVVNDSFLVTSSKVLQSYADQWQMYKANDSMSFVDNESFSSVCSDTDIIQMKDDLIEKLLTHSEALSKELKIVKEENVELEMKIRQEVVQEYSEFADQLLENQRQNNEAALTAMRDAYEARISSMKKRYEDMIAMYQAQSETEESFADTSMSFNLSSKELPDSDKHPVQKSPGRKDKGEMPQPTDDDKWEQKYEIMRLEKQKLHTELDEALSAAANLRQEIDAKESENADLKKKVAALENICSSCKKEIDESKEKIQELTKNFTSALKESEKSIVLLNSQNEELRKELNTMKQKHDDAVNRLQLNVEDLKDELSRSHSQLKLKESSINELNSELNLLQQKHENAVSVFKKKVEVLTDELKTANAHLELKEFSANELKTELEELREKIQAQENDNDFRDKKDALNDDIVKELQRQISSLEQDSEELRRALGIKSANCDKMESEIGAYKLKIESLESWKKRQEETLQNASTYESTIIELELDLSSAKSEINALKKELELKLCQDKSSKSSDIGTKSEPTVDAARVETLTQELISTTENLEASKVRIQMMSLTIAELEKEKQELKQKAEKYKHDYKASKAQVSELNSMLKEHKDNVANLQKELSLKNNVINSSSNKIQELEKNCTLEHKNPIEEFKTKVEHLEKSLKCAEADNKEMASLLSEKEKKLKELEQLLSLSKQDLTATKDELSKKSEIIQRQKRESSQQLENLQEYKTKVACLEDYLNSAEAEDKKRTSLISEKEEELKKFKQLLFLSDQELIATKESSQKLENQLQEYKTKVAQLEKSLKCVEAEKKELTSLVSKKENEIKELEQNLSVSKQEISSAKDELSQKFEIIKQLKSEVESLSSQIGSSTISFQAEKNQLNDEIASLQDENKEISNELSSTTALLNETSKKMEENLLKVKDLESETCRLKTVIENESDRIKELESFNKSELDAYKENLETVKEELKFANEKWTIQSLSCKELQEEVLDLKKKLCEKGKEIKSLEVAERKAQKAVEVLKEEKNKLEQEVATLQSRKKSLEKESQCNYQNSVSLASEVTAAAGKLEEMKNSSLGYKKEVSALKKKNDILLSKNETLEKAVEDYETRIEMYLGLICLLQSIEIKSFDNACILRLEKRKETILINNLKSQILQKESAIADLEKAICDQQNCVKETKLEIDLKKSRKVTEKENVPEASKPVKRSQSKKISNVKKKSSVLHQKQQKLKETSFSSDESLLEVVEIEDDDELSVKSVKRASKPVKRSQSKKISNVKKKSSVLHPKQQELKQTSFSSDESVVEVVENEDEMPSLKSVKRASDLDFEDPKAKRKRTKISSENKCSKNEPIRKNSRASKQNMEKAPSQTSLKQGSSRTRKLKVENEKPVSPVQKFAKQIGDKFKSVYEHVIPSPPVTRHKRQLYNPETSSIQVRAATRSRKANEKK